MRNKKSQIKVGNAIRQIRKLRDEIARCQRVIQEWEQIITDNGGYQLTDFERRHKQ